MSFFAKGGEPPPKNFLSFRFPKEDKRCGTLCKVWSLRQRATAEIPHATSVACMSLFVSRKDATLCLHEKIGSFFDLD